jgi:DNA-binding transcriptional LysR family regulator
MYTHYFQYFEEVARSGSVTKAAKNLHISQQALSEYIKRMETHYGIALFNRKPTLHLTHAGELLREYIRQSAYREEQLLADFSRIRKQQVGRIRLGITPTRAPIFFPLIFTGFNRLHPAVELSLREDHTQFLVKDLAEGKIDFVIALEHTGAQISRMVTSTTLLQDRKLYFLATKPLLVSCGFQPRRLPHAVKFGVSLEEIKNVPVILKPGSSLIHDQIFQEYQKRKAKPKIVIESSHVFPLLPLCAAGNVGVFVSHTILRYINGHYPQIMEAVLSLPVNNLEINCDISLMYCVNETLSVHFGDFVKVTREVFAGYGEDQIC